MLASIQRSVDRRMWRPHAVYKSKTQSACIAVRLACILLASCALARPGLDRAATSDQDAIQREYAKAVEYFQRGQIDLAERELSEIIKAAPQVPEPFFLLGKVWLMKHQAGKAEELLRQATRIKPDFPEAYQSLGVALLAQNKYREAAETFLIAIRQNPGYAPAHINLANAYLGLNRITEAEVEFQNGLRLAPQDKATVFVANRNLGALYYRRGEYSYAISHLEIARSLDEQNVGVLLPLCDAYLKLHRQADASVLVDRISQLANQAPELHLRLGILLVANESYAEAYPHLQEARKLLPADFELLQALAIADYQLHRFAEAEQVLSEALTIKQTPQSYRLLGEVYLAQNDVRALEALEKCISLEPTDDKAWEELSKELARRKEFDHAVDLFQHHAEQYPRSLLARLLLGEAYFNRSRFKQAAEQFQKALELDRSEARTYYSLGLLYKRIGAAEDAKANLEQALRLNPGSALTNYNMGDLFLMEKNYPEASRFLAQAIKLNPDEAEFHFKLGELYSLEKRYGAAAGELRRAIQLRPDYSEAHYLLARCYAAQNKIELAGAEYAASRAPRSANAHKTDTLHQPASRRSSIQ
jgi:tetratricopeptide (TPR) repeat protein